MALAHCAVCGYVLSCKEGGLRKPKGNVMRRLKLSLVAAAFAAILTIIGVNHASAGGYYGYGGYYGGYKSYGGYYGKRYRGYGYRGYGKRYRYGYKRYGGYYGKRYRYGYKKRYRGYKRRYGGYYGYYGY